MAPNVHWKDEDKMLHGNGIGHLLDPSSTSLSSPASSRPPKVTYANGFHNNSSFIASSPFAITRRAVLELPLDLTNKDSNSSNNNGSRFPVLSLRPASKLTMSTSFPLIGSSLSATLDAKGGVRGQTGYSATKAGLIYRLNDHHKVSAVTLLDHNGHVQHVTLSAQRQLSSGGASSSSSNVQVSLQSQHVTDKPQTLSSILWKPTLSWSTPLLFSNVVTLRTHASLTFLNGPVLQALGYYTQQVATQIASADATTHLTLADCPVQPTQYGVAMESHQTRHVWSVGLSHSRQRPYQLQWSVAPRLTLFGTERTLGLSGSYRFVSTAATASASGFAKLLSGLQFVWAANKDNNKTASPLALSQIKISILDSGSSSSYNSLATGVGAWAYVVSITTRGDFTLRVPIVIATSAMADPFLYPLQAFYVGAVSWLVQEVALRIMTGMAASEKNNTATTINQRPGKLDDDKDRRKRERQEAENQQMLMSFQATRRRKVEEEANGLVVKVAVYYTAKEQLDVTVPLRFWVSDSSLSLAETSKSQLLGFCDLSTEKKHHRRRKQPSWISGFWRRETNSNSTSSTRVTPKLSVEYTYRGASYQITVEDDEELVLPSDRARLVRAAKQEQQQSK